MPFGTQEHSDAHGNPKATVSGAQLLHSKPRAAVQSGLMARSNHAQISRKRVASEYGAHEEKPLNQWIGLREHLQESPIFNGKIYSMVSCKFSLRLTNPMIKREEISRKYGESTRVLTNQLDGNMTDPSDPLGNLGTAKTVAFYSSPIPPLD